MKENEKYLKAIISAIPDLVFLVNTDGKYLDVLATGKEHLLYKPKEEIIGKYITDFFDQETSKKLHSLVKKTIETMTLQCLEYELFLTSKKEFFEARVVPAYIKESNKDTVIVIVRDISKKRERENTVNIVETVFEEATEGIIIEDSNRNVIHVNPAILRILNLKENDLIGKRSNYLSKMLSIEIQENIRSTMKKNGHWYGEVEVKRFDNEVILAWITIDAVLDKEGKPANFVIMITDVSELHISKKKMKYLATHDTLTNLPNRVLIFEHLNHAIDTAKRTGNNGALLFIDIDDFKSINDNYSHQVGDLLLHEFAIRLSHITRKSDIVGRLSGDEFLLILENINEMEDILGVIEKIRIQLMTAFSINGLNIEITVSIGAACFPANGDNADQLVHAADQAMYNVKNNGKDGFKFYTKEFSIISHEYFLIQNALKKAIKEDEFTIVYQPQFSLLDNSLTGIEALLRCNNLDIKDIPISRLISIAEESNIIHNISRFVMQRCCRQIVEWQEFFLSPLKIAVNLSRKELSDENLVQVITENLISCNIKPSILEFEITESTLLQNSNSAKNNIDKLRKLGCSFSIDDYGTGFSSLSNLREFDLDKIKIDRSFITDLEHNNNDRIIVSATINMVKALGLTVLSEGVETKGQEKLLKKFGCDEVQGYLYSHPLTAEEISKLLIPKK
jgi:diguanylate cyclase (GGDEF)-like protein/PAS domain S-box-containing protein